jgi:replicative DNA helicase
VPELRHLRESGDLEQDVDVVIFLYRHEVYVPDSPRRTSPTSSSPSTATNGPPGQVILYMEKAKGGRFRDVDMYNLPPD